MKSIWCVDGGVGVGGILCRHVLISWLWGCWLEIYAALAC